MAKYTDTVSQDVNRLSNTVANFALCNTKTLWKEGDEIITAGQLCYVDAFKTKPVYQ